MTMARGSLRNYLPFARALLVTAWTCLVSPLRAGDAPFSLKWNAPEGAQCPSEAEVVAQVLQLLESSRQSQRAFVRARADVQRTGNQRFRVDLTTEMEGRAGHRAIEEQSCQAMAEATVLILAWMIDPKAVGTPQSSERDAPPSVGSDAPRTRASQPPRSLPTRAVQVSPRRGEWQPVFGVEMLADEGTLPSPALGAALAAGLRSDRLQLMARGALFNSVEARLPDPKATLGASFALSSVRAEICGSPIAAAPSWRMAACAGPELDRLVAHGFGVDAPRSATVTWLSLALGADARFRLAGPFELAVALGLNLPTRRERFGLDGLGMLHRPAVASGRAALGLYLVF